MFAFFMARWLCTQLTPFSLSNPNAPFAFSRPCGQKHFAQRNVSILNWHAKRSPVYGPYNDCQWLFITILLYLPVLKSAKRVFFSHPVAYFVSLSVINTSIRSNLEPTSCKHTLMSSSSAHSDVMLLISPGSSTCCDVIVTSLRSARKSRRRFSSSAWTTACV